eukprot:TRINITY_DN15600_c0_g1_i1.p1 TRINITY_DN15600_c0_g1~~TRINITY_DN15600_c0_g1_i1.p1  ORF type:complete len:413 (+),score=51.34 TRINITY_DN15600_c0_g1_i1:155-1240(+)
MRLQDLRSNNTRQISNFLVRDEYVVVIIEHIMAIVTPKRCLLLRADSANIASLASKLSVSLKNKHHGQSFEFVIIQEMLEAICQEFETRFSLLEKVVNKLLSQIYATPDTDVFFTKLVPLNRSLITFQFSVKELFSILEALLENDTDLTKMCLSTKTPQTRIEVELLLEEYYKKLEEITNEIAQLQRNITSTQEAIQMSLSRSRNEIMRLNLYISLASMGFAAGSMVAGIFGMNLLSGLEAHPSLFYWVAFSVPVLAMTLPMTVAIYFTIKSGHFLKTSRRTLTSSFFDDIHSLHYIKQLAGTKDPETLRKILSEAIGEELTQEESNEIWQITSKWEKRAYLVDESEFLGRFYGQDLRERE